MNYPSVYKPFWRWAVHVFRCETAPSRIYFLHWLALFCFPVQPLLADNQTVDGPLPAKPPSVRSAYARSAMPGERISLEVSGDFLDGATVLCDRNDIVAKVLHSTPLVLDVELTVKASAPPGPRFLWVESARGRSAAFLFRVTSWDRYLESEPNDLVDGAQLIPSLPAFIEGRLAKISDSDFFRFRVQANETLAFNLLVGRNGIAGNLAMTLIDASGRSIDQNLSRFVFDSYLVHTFAEAGEYVVVLTPRRFADQFSVIPYGSDPAIDVHYQLTIGRNPILKSVFPLGGKRGSTVKAQLLADFMPLGSQPAFSGKGVTGTLAATDDPCSCQFELTIHITPDADLGPHELTVPDNSGTQMPLLFQVSDLPEITEQELDSNGLKTERVPWPVAVNGQINHPKDRDTFEFEVRDQDWLRLEIEARQLGSTMTDPAITLLTEKGEPIDKADDRCDLLSRQTLTECSATFPAGKGRQDSLLSHRFVPPSGSDVPDASGKYLVQVRDLSSRGGNGHAYRLTLRREEPGFRLALATNLFHGAAGSSAKIAVHLARRAGFQGAIELKVLGLPEGFRSEPVRVTGQEEKVVLTVVDERSPDGIIQDSIVSFPFQIEGSATAADKQEIRALAQSPPFLTADGPGYLEAPRFGAQAAFVQPPSFDLAFEKQFPGSIALGASQKYQAELHVRIKHGPRFTESLIFRPVGFPSGVEIQSVDMSKDRDSAILKLVANPEKTENVRRRVTIQAVAMIGTTEYIDSLPGFYLEVR